MPVYNNLNGYNNRANINGPTNNNAWGNGYDAVGQYSQTVPQPQPQMPMQPMMNADTRVFVNGRAGADSYPMPQGVNTQALFDRNEPRLYIKAYDNNGYPSIVEDYDLVKHVEPEPPQYVTKDELRAILEEMLGDRTERAARPYRNDQRKGAEK